MKITEDDIKKEKYNAEHYVQCGRGCVDKHIFLHVLEQRDWYREQYWDMNKDLAKHIVALSERLKKLENPQPTNSERG